MENYYSILGVEPSSSKQEIRRAYLKQLKKYHPDVYNGDKKMAENVTIELNNAYTILSDIEKRRDYDSQLRTNKNNVTKQKPQTNSDSKASTYKTTTEKNSNTSEKFKSDNKNNAKTKVDKRENDNKNVIRKVKKASVSLSKTKLNFAIVAVVLAIIGLIFLLIVI